MAVSFSQTKDANDPVPCLRVYPTMGHTCFNLQIRATAPLGDRISKKDLKARNLIATISLTAEELLRLADYINLTLRPTPVNHPVWKGGGDGEVNFCLNCGKTILEHDEHFFCPPKSLKPE